MKTLRDALIIGWWKSWPDLRRQPLLIPLIMIISALPLFFLYVFSSGNVLSIGIIGALVGTLAFLAANSSLQELGQDRYLKIREMMVAMPVSPIAYSTGIALSSLIISLPSILFYMIIAGLLGLLSLGSVLWITLALTLAWTSLSAMGFAISTYFTKANVNTLNNIANILGITLVFLPPVYYSEARLGSLSWLAAIIPTSNAASLVRYYTGLTSLSSEELLLRWGLLVLMSLLFTALVAAKVRWREA
jgi:ABC-2 type transport system permease protein